MVIWCPKIALRGMKFFGGIPNSLLKEFWPMVHTSLLYYGNVSGPMTIFEVIFFQFLHFELNLWCLKSSDLDEILHGGSTWCEVPPVKIWSKSVNFKGGNNINFRKLYPENTFFTQIKVPESCQEVIIFFSDFIWVNLQVHARFQGHTSTLR